MATRAAPVAAEALLRGARTARVLARRVLHRVVGVTDDAAWTLSRGVASGEVQLCWTEPIAGGSEPVCGFLG